MPSKKPDSTKRAEYAECIAGLLKTSELTVKEIFVQLETRNTPAIRGAFVRAYGNTFSAYRRACRAEVKASEAWDVLSALATKAPPPTHALLDPAKRRHGRPAVPRVRPAFKSEVSNQIKEDSEEITPTDQKESNMNKDQSASKNRVLKAIAEGLLDFAQAEELITPKDDRAGDSPPELFNSDVLWFVLHRVVHSPKDLIEVLDNLSIQDPNAFNRAFEAQFELSMEEYRERYWFQSDHPMALRDHHGIAALMFKTNSKLEVISDALMNTPWSTEAVLRRFGVENDPFTQRTFRNVFGCDVSDYPLPSEYGHGESARSEVEEDPIAAEVDLTLCQGPTAGVVAGGERARWFPIVINGVFEHTVRIVAKAGVLPPYAQKDLLIKYFDQIDQFVEHTLRPLFKGEFNVAYLQTLPGQNAPPYNAQAFAPPRTNPGHQGTRPKPPLTPNPFTNPTPPVAPNSFVYPSPRYEAPASGQGSFPQTEYPPQFGAVYRDPRSDPGHPQHGDWVKKQF